MVTIDRKQPIDNSTKESTVTLSEVTSYPDGSASSIKASSLERRLESWLLQQKIKYFREYELPGCIHIGQLYVDFYLPEYNIVIELDGQHHFIDKVVYGHLLDDKDSDTKSTTQVTDLSVVVARDKSKNNYMIHNKIHLLRIAYTHMDKEYSKKGDFSLPYEKYVAKFIRSTVLLKRLTPITPMTATSSPKDLRSTFTTEATVIISPVETSSTCSTTTSSTTESATSLSTIVSTTSSTTTTISSSITTATATATATAIKDSYSLKWFIGDEYSSCKSLSSLVLYLAFIQDSEQELLAISDNGKLPLILIEHQDPNE